MPVAQTAMVQCEVSTRKDDDSEGKVWSRLILIRGSIFEEKEDAILKMI